MNNSQILWGPEKRRCGVCGTKCDHVRRFTASGVQTFFCLVCWKEFLSECKAPNGDWKEKINILWDSMVNLELIFSEIKWNHIKN